MQLYTIDTAAAAETECLNLACISRLNVSFACGNAAFMPCRRLILFFIYHACNGYHGEGDSHLHNVVLALGTCRVEVCNGKIILGVTKPKTRHALVEDGEIALGSER